MKIVYLHQYFKTPEMSGITRSYEFARRLVDRGHEVHVITSDTEAVPGRSAVVWRTSVEAGAVVHWASVPYQNAMGFRDRVSAFGRFARVAASRAAALQQDVVFATSTPLTIAIPGIYSARRRRVPMVLEIRDVWPEVPIALNVLRSPVTRGAAGMLEGWAYRSAERIIALSPGMADSITRRFPEMSVTVIPNGCDRALFAPADDAGTALRKVTPWLQHRPLVLYAGTLGFANDVSYVVRMAAALRDLQPEIRVAIVGTGAEEQKIRELSRTLGVLDRNLFMLNQIPKSAVVSMFGAADLALSVVRDNPSMHATSPNKVFDGFAAGRPVGINHEGWLADTLRRSGAGLVLPADDPAKAGRLVGDFLADERRVAAARSAARRLAETEFDRDLLFNRLEQVLLEAVDGTQQMRRRWLARGRHPRLPGPSAEDTVRLETTGHGAPLSGKSAGAEGSFSRAE
ncbi:glycosyltransferase family 4 protein [Micromonospora sp. C95]|uniref:glycosyltransferase family 4 protein n=1 Tax=Micromonospora sp. C95 TaxID=2824882 RepID=UPI001B381656|nr:glycosyltransferase family 4 protein [Micromonospora sp. C95]MBQ1024152.1 glycosyltransferase family 4 protein [Micromonospora sp. C95]